MARLVTPEAMADPGLRQSLDLVGVLPYAVDPEAAERLWTLSEELIGAR